MKYVAPYGISDPNAGYINGDPSIARQGSIPPAEAFEHPMRELVAVISKSGLTPDAADLQQVAKGVRSQALNYALDTGSANTLSVAFDPPLTAYSIGLPIRVKVHTTNTGPSTIDAGGGRVPVRKPSGAEMAAGDLPAAAMAEMVYDGTVFQMINFGGAGGGGASSVFLVNIPYTVDTGTPNVVIANFSPALTSYTAGMIFMVKVTNTNSTFATVNVNGLGPKTINAQGGHAAYPLLPGDLQAGDTIVFIYDGTVFWIYPNPAINQAVSFAVSTLTHISDLFAALGRKRISTTGGISINMAAGVYGPSGTATITTSHIDADRITLIGTMKPSQVPPTFGDFQRSGSSPAARAADSAFNIIMLRARYATEIVIPTSGVAFTHVGIGQINLQNVLITGPNSLVVGQRGVSANDSKVSCTGVSVWGSGDVGFATVGSGHIWTWNCHACSCGSRGYTAGNGATMQINGGGSYGNATHGVEASYGAAITTGATDGSAGSPYGTLANGCQFACNGGAGTSAQQGTVYVTTTYVNVNASTDMYAFNMGSSAQYKSSVNTMSPAAGTVGNLNSISVNYGT